MFPPFISRDDMAMMLDIIERSLEGGDSCLVGVMAMLGELVPFSTSTCVWAEVKKDEAGPFKQINLNYPEEWSEVYIREGFHRVDPIFREHFRTFGLQYWADTYKMARPPDYFLSLSRDFGLADGYTFGAMEPDGGAASLVSVSGPGLPDDKRSRFIIGRVAPHLHYVIRGVAKGSEPGRLPVLSGREKEVLKWLAEGKTAWETSVIMGISERTVRFHVANASGKMDAVSAIHATAKAVRLGIIDLA